MMFFVKARMKIFHFFLQYFLQLNRNIFYLAVSQAFSMTAMNINMITTALAGFLIAPYGWMSTLPLSLQFLTTMISTVPSSLLMARFGRRPIFLLGVFFTFFGGILMGLSLIYKLFLVFCFGSMCLGIGHSIAQFYRYAATETVSEDVRPKAMSLVLSAGIIAAFLGPALSKLTALGISDAIYSASFFAIAGVQFLALPCILFLKIPLPKSTTSGGRSLSIILKQKQMIKALISAAGGYAIMSYLMTATPLQIVNICNFSISENATIIQWHVVAMFAPSFITGTLIMKYTVNRVLYLGIVCYILMVIVSLIAETTSEYLLALVLLGLGWNFLYVGGSSLLVSLVKPEEQGKVQGVADFIIIGSVAFSSLSAGFIHYFIGWDKMVLGILPFILIILISNIDDIRKGFFAKQ